MKAKNKNVMGFGVAYPQTGGCIVRQVGASHQYFPNRREAAKFFRDTADWLDKRHASQSRWWHRFMWWRS